MMGGDHRSGVDPSLVEAWVKGWALARGTSSPVLENGAFRVDVGWPMQRTRHVFPALGDAVGRLAEAVVEPWIYIKVCAPPEVVRPFLPRRWTIQAPSFLMTGPSVDPAIARTVPADYAFQDDDALNEGVRVFAANGDLAASGHMAVVGDYVIYDRIETHADHRRRGLGRIVMAQLAAKGRDLGASRGVLVATGDGRALYETLGWRVQSPYTSAVILGD